MEKSLNGFGPFKFLYVYLNPNPHRVNTDGVQNKMLGYFI